MNRFKITKKSFEDTKKFLSGKLDLSKAPKYAQKFRDQLVVKGSSLYYKGKRLLAREDVDDYLRKKIYSRGSIIQMNRDQGYAGILKEVWGVPRRTWYNWLSQQTKLRATDKAVPEIKKSGKRATGLREIHADLMELRKSQLPKTLKSIKDSYISVVVHRVTGLIHLTHIPNKQPATVTPKLLAAIEWICKQLGRPVKGTLLYTDSGFEYSTEDIRKKGIIHRALKLAASAENAVGRTRRTLFKVLSKKVGGIKASLQQTMDILNNSASSIHKNKSPLEVAKQTQDISVAQFNTKRQLGKNKKRTQLVVGTLVRRVLRAYKKTKMYKSNSSEQWDPKKYKILGVSRKEPFRYKLNVTEKIRNKMVTHDKWHNRDELQVVGKDDVKTRRLLENREQSGSEKKTYVRKKKASPQKIRRSERIQKNKS